MFIVITITYIIMRFIIIYRSPIFHIRRERLDIEVCTSTDQILDALDKKLSHLEAMFVYRVVKDTSEFRIIKGWPIDHYAIS